MPRLSSQSCILLGFVAGLVYTACADATGRPSGGIGDALAATASECGGWEYKAVEMDDGCKATGCEAGSWEPIGSVYAHDILFRRCTD